MLNYYQNDNTMYYDMIFKRKSFHTFKSTIPFTNKDLELIKQKIDQLEPLIDTIKVSIQVVPKSQTTCKRGEYCILIYSEVKENYLQNVGYLGEQLDLSLALDNIGCCWYGIGKPLDQGDNEMPFVIMLSIAKTSEIYFRKDYKKARRRAIQDIWEGNPWDCVSSVIRYAPSACNVQSWLISNQKDRILLYRVKGKRTILIPGNKLSYYNRLNIGIMMLFIEVCLDHESRAFRRELFADFTQEEDKVLNASYLLS